jgi:hypothetical protein
VGRAPQPPTRAGKDNAPAFQRCDHQQGSASGRFAMLAANRPQCPGSRGHGTLDDPNRPFRRRA